MRRSQTRRSVAVSAPPVANAKVAPVHSWPGRGEPARERVALGGLDQRRRRRVPGERAAGEPLERRVGVEHRAVGRQRRGEHRRALPGVALDLLADHGDARSARAPRRAAASASPAYASAPVRSARSAEPPNAWPPTSTHGAGSRPRSAAQTSATCGTRSGSAADSATSWRALLGGERGEVLPGRELAEEGDPPAVGLEEVGHHAPADRVQLVAHARDDRGAGAHAAPARRRGARPAAPSRTAWRRSRGAPARR